jgi:hypothetical protein
MSHRDIERLRFLILFPGQKHRRMFLGRIRSTATAGIAADSPDRRQRPLDDRPYLRQRPNQLFLLFLYGGIVFHNAIKYNSFMALSSEGATSLDTTARASLIRTISRQATRILNLEEENQELKNLVKALKDEIRRLKGEKGRPALKPSLPDQPGEEKKPRRTGNWKKSGKTITVTRTERLSIKPAVLPADARYKGTRRVIIQDLRIEPDNVAFEIERSYSAQERKTYESPLPPGYAGSTFGPGIRHLVLTLHYQGRMPQKLLQTFLSGMGVVISEGEIALLVRNGAPFETEIEAACRAAVRKHGYQHIDDTGARLLGKNGATIVTGNESFVAYRTGPHKNRLAALQALWRTEHLRYRLDQEAIAYIRSKLPHTALDKILKRFGTRVFATDEDFEKNVLGHPEVRLYGPQTLRYVREAAAVAAFRAEDPTQQLVCDDAGQFKGLTRYLQLCWVHAGRHFKILDPSTPEFREILDRFLKALWAYYDRLLEYQQAPRRKDKARLWREFDLVFKPETGYYALDRRIQKIRGQKAELLTALSFPALPLQNNPCELDVREKVVQRKIRNCHRSRAGAKASDLFLGLMGTCRKNEISFWAFLRARIYQTHAIPNLQKIISTSPSRGSPQATTY